MKDVGYRSVQQRRFVLFFLWLAFASLGLALFPAENSVAQANDPTNQDRSSVEDFQKQNSFSTDGWSSWGHDLINSRFSLDSKIKPENLAKVHLKWSFVFPNSTATANQPIVVGDTLFVGSWDAKVYALHAKTGQLKWVYDTLTFTGPVPVGPAGNAVRDTPIYAEGKLYFGDTLANAYAVNAKTGALIWAKKIDTHPAARITSSPVIWQNKIYFGISSNETALAVAPVYPCCTFRGSMVALNVANGAEVWRYYTVPPPQQTGVNSSGTPVFGPSGAAVWSSPAIDPLSGTLYFGTGQNYSLPVSNRSDSVIALDARTGLERWGAQLTPNDRWNVACNPEIFGLPPEAGPNCPMPSANDKDHDIGTAPTLFATFANGKFRLLVGAGQKSGVYHALDAKTGAIVWQTLLGRGDVPGGQGGIQWGSSWDGQRLYVSTNQAQPGTISALDPATGKLLWNTKNPATGCDGALLPYCALAMPAPATSSDGLVYQGSMDGKLRIYNSKKGTQLWEFNTAQTFIGVNGLAGSGGSINASGVTLTDKMFYVNSGYLIFPGSGMPGNVLLAFSL